MKKRSGCTGRPPEAGAPCIAHCAAMNIGEWSAVHCASFGDELQRVEHRALRILRDNPGRAVWGA
ncbi:hypothetical protein ACTQ56_09255 [[Clostridium] aminophilum]|uniref:hypothetical protein n=1 Tax=[Clostridium] aminophilum TaxID=1526 RepID=UPI003F9CE966